MVAGGGSLPGELVAAVSAEGRDTVVIAIESEADDAIRALDPYFIGWGQIGRLIKLMNQHGCQDVVLIGHIRKRPDVASIIPDFKTIKLMPRMARAVMAGDDAAAKKIVDEFQSEGFRVRGIAEVAPSLLAPAGDLATSRPDRSNLKDIDIGRAALADLGRYDIGQGAVVVNGRIICVEAAEGTDAMLERCQALHEAQRVRWRGRAGVFVKCTKPGQTILTDLPAIGPETIRRVADARLAGIAIETDHVIIANRDKCLKLANQNNIFLTGIPGRSHDGQPQTTG